MITRLKPNTLRVGCRVYAVGLQKAVELNGQKGTVTRQQGGRWGVLFDSGASKAVLPANLRTKPRSIAHAEPCASLTTEDEQAMTGLARKQTFIL